MASSPFTFWAASSMASGSSEPRIRPIALKPTSHRTGPPARAGSEALNVSRHGVSAVCSGEGIGARRGTRHGMEPRPNHQIYIGVLRSMSGEDRLRKAFELSAFARELFITGLRRRYPELQESELRQLYLRRIQKSWDRRE